MKRGRWDTKLRKRGKWGGEEKEQNVKFHLEALAYMTPF